MSGDERPTGEQLLDELRAAAHRAGVSLASFAAPIFPNSWKLEQMRIAEQPKPLTVERVRSLIDGRPIPEGDGRYERDPRAFGLSRLQAEEAGIPPSRRSICEQRRLDAVRARRRHEEQVRALSEAAKDSRRPGQRLVDRLRELQREIAA